MYVDEFKQLAEQHEHFHYYPVLSQAKVHWQGAKGYVQQHLANNIQVLDDLSACEFYLCGPKALMDETITMLKDYQLDDSAIFFDSFS